MSCHSLVEKENTVWISVLGCLLCPLLVCMDSWWMNGLIAVNGRKRSRQRNNKCAEPLSAGVQGCHSRDTNESATYKSPLSQSMVPFAQECSCLLEAKPKFAPLVSYRNGLHRSGGFCLPLSLGHLCASGTGLLMNWFC